MADEVLDEGGVPVKDFAAKIKAKYPQYAGMNDTDLAKKIIAKYPDYASQVDFGEVKKKETVLPIPSPKPTGGSAIPQSKSPSLQSEDDEPTQTNSFAPSIINDAINTPVSENIDTPKEKGVPIVQPSQDDPISKVKQIKDLESATKFSSPTSVTDEFQTTVPDEEKRTEGKKLREQLKQQYGLKDSDIEDLHNTFSDFPEAAYDITDEHGNKNQTKEQLLAQYVADPIGTKSKINNIKTQFDLQNAAYNNALEQGYSEHDAQQAAINTGNSFIGLHQKPRQSLPDLEKNIQAQQQVVGDYLTGDQRDKALQRIQDNSSQFINSTVPAVVDEYNKSPLKDLITPDEFAGLKTWQLFDPQKYKQAIDILGTSTEEFTPAASNSYLSGMQSAKPKQTGGSIERTNTDNIVGQELIHRQLLAQGRENALTQIAAQKRSLENAAKDPNANIAQLKVQHDALQNKEDEIKYDAQGDNARFPYTAGLEADKQLKEATQQAGIGVLGYGVERFGHGFEETGNTVEDLLTNVFGSNTDKTALTMKRMGENAKFESKMYLPENLKSDNSPFVYQIDPKLKSEANKIIAGRNISDLPKEDNQKLKELFLNNQDLVKTVTNPNLGKSKNFWSKSTAYNVSGFTGDIASFMAQNALLGGTGMGAKAAELSTLFSTAYAPAYDQAISEGKSPSIASQYALVHGGVAMAAGLISSKYDAVKNILKGSDTPLSKAIAGMGEAAWNKAVKNTPKNIIDKMIAATKNVAGEQAKMVGTFGIAQPLAEKRLDALMFNGKNTIGDDVKSSIDGVKNMVVGSIPLMVLGFASKVMSKSFTPLDKVALWENGDDAPLGKAKIDEAVKSGQLTLEQGEDRKKVIDKVAELIPKVPDENEKGEKLNDEEKADYLFNLYFKDKAKGDKTSLPKQQQEKVDAAVEEADKQNGDILSGLKTTTVIKPEDNKPATTIEIAPKESKPSEKSKGAAIILPNREQPNVIEVGGNKNADTKLSEPIQGLDEQGIPTGDNVPPSQENVNKNEDTGTGKGVFAKLKTEKTDDDFNKSIDAEQKGELDGWSGGNLALDGDVRELWEMPVTENTSKVKTGDLGVTEKGELGTAFNPMEMQPRMIKDALQEGRYEKAIKDGRMTPAYAQRIIESAGLEVPQDILIDAGVQKNKFKGVTNQPIKETVDNKQGVAEKERGDIEDKKQMVTLSKEKIKGTNYENKPSEDSQAKLQSQIAYPFDRVEEKYDTIINSMAEGVAEGKLSLKEAVDGANRVWGGKVSENQKYFASYGLEIPVEITKEDLQRVIKERKQVDNKQEGKEEKVGDIGTQNVPMENKDYNTLVEKVPIQEGRETHNIHEVKTTKEIAAILGVNTPKAFKIMSELEKEGKAFKYGYRVKGGWEDVNESNKNSQSVGWQIESPLKQENNKPKEEIDIGNNITIEPNIEDGHHRVYKHGKFVGLLSSVDFIQASNDGQHFDANLMYEVLDKMGVKHGDAEFSRTDKNDFIKIRIKDYKAVDKFILGGNSESVNKPKEEVGKQEGVSSNSNEKIVDSPDVVRLNKILKKDNAGNLKEEIVNVSDLVVSDTASPQKELEDGFKDNGVVPILIDENNQVLDGERRLATLKKMGVTNIPVFRWTGGEFKNDDARMNFDFDYNNNTEGVPLKDLKQPQKQNTNTNEGVKEEAKPTPEINPTQGDKVKVPSKYGKPNEYTFREGKWQYHDTTGKWQVLKGKDLELAETQFKKDNGLVDIKSFTDKVRQTAQDIREGKVAGFGKGMEGVQTQGFGGKAFNEAAAKALEIFADSIDAFEKVGKIITKDDFAKAVSDGYEHFRNYLKDSAKSFDDAKFKQAFEKKAQELYSPYNTGKTKLNFQNEFGKEAKAESEVPPNTPTGENQTETPDNEGSVLTKKELSKYDSAKEVFDKESSTTWNEITDRAVTKLIKNNPDLSLDKAAENHVNRLAKLYDEGNAINPTAEDLAIINLSKLYTENKIAEIKDWDGDSAEDRLSAMQDLEPLWQHLQNIAKAANPREAGTAFGIRQMLVSMGADGLKISRMRLMKDKGGEKLSEADMKFTAEQFSKEKQLLEQQHELEKTKLKESFDNEIKAQKDKYESLLSEKAKLEIHGERAKTRAEKLQQSGKAFADKLRSGKISGAKSDPFLLSTSLNFIIDRVADIVEGGTSLAAAIDKYVSENNLQKKRAAIENAILDHIDRTEKRSNAVEKLDKIISDSGSTKITKEMLGTKASEPNLIKDFTDSYINSVDLGQVEDVAFKLLKEKLPNITKEEFKRAYLKTGEFKPDTSKQLRNQSAAEKRNLGRLMQLEKDLGELTKKGDLLRSKGDVEGENNVETKIQDVKNKIEKELTKQGKKRASSSTLQREADAKVSDTHDKNIDNYVAKFSENKDLLGIQKNAVDDVLKTLSDSKINFDADSKLSQKSKITKAIDALDIVKNKLSELKKGIPKDLYYEMDMGLQNIKDVYDRVSNDENQKVLLQEAKNTAISKIKETERKLNNHEFDDTPPKRLLTKTDTELTKIHNDLALVNSAFEKRKEQYRRSKRNAGQVLLEMGKSIGVNALIFGIKTSVKLIAASPVKIFTTYFSKATVGQLNAIVFDRALLTSAKEGGESSSFASNNQGLDAVFKHSNENEVKEQGEKANKVYEGISRDFQKSNDALSKMDKDSPEYQKAVKENKKLKTKTEKALRKSVANIMYQFIGGKTWDTLVEKLKHRNTAYEQSMGEFGGEQWTKVRDWTHVADNIAYIASTVGRAHGALKSISGRFHYAAAFTARLEGAMERGDIDITDIRELNKISADCFADWSMGMYQQDNKITTFLNKVVNNAKESDSRVLRAIGHLASWDVAITKVPVNQINEAITEMVLGLPLSLGKYVAIKSEARGIAKAAIPEIKTEAQRQAFRQIISDHLSQMDKKQAAQIVRMFRHGGLGLGMLGVAVYFSAIKYGGWHHFGEKRDDKNKGDDVPKTGEIMGEHGKWNQYLSAVLEHTTAAYPALAYKSMLNKWSYSKSKSDAGKLGDVVYTELEHIVDSYPQSKIFNPLSATKEIYKMYSGAAKKDITTYTGGAIQFPDDNKKSSKGSQNPNNFNHSPHRNAAPKFH